MVNKIRAFAQKYSFYAILSPVVLLQIFFIAIPLLFLIYRGFCAGNLIEALSWFNESFFFSIILRSIAYALTTTFFCFIIGYPLATFIAFSSSITQKALLFFMCVPFLSNFILHIASWTFLIQSNGFVSFLLERYGFASGPVYMLYSHGAVLLGMVYCYLPFMVVPLYTALEKFDYSLCEASYDLGASWWKTLYKVIIPGTKRGIIAGSLLVFVPSCSEFFIPELLGGDRYMNMGSLLSYLTLSSSLLQHAALCTLFLVVILIITSLSLAFCIKKVVDWGAH